MLFFTHLAGRKEGKWRGVGVVELGTRLGGGDGDGDHRRSHRVVLHKGEGPGPLTYPQNHPKLPQNTSNQVRNIINHWALPPPMSISMGHRLREIRILAPLNRPHWPGSPGVPAKTVETLFRDDCSSWFSIYSLEIPFSLKRYCSKMET